MQFLSVNEQLGGSLPGSEDEANVSSSSSVMQKILFYTTFLSVGIITTVFSVAILRKIAQRGRERRTASI